MIKSIKYLKDNSIDFIFSGLVLFTDSITVSQVGLTQTKEDELYAEVSKDGSIKKKTAEEGVVIDLKKFTKEEVMEEFLL